jgi:tRNA (guanine37-N1)-methyltransferase
VLLSGNHAAIEQWRHDQAVRRTAARRPDLLHPSRTFGLAGLEDAEIRAATRADAGELLTLQRACWVQEALANPGVTIPALGEDLADVERYIGTWLTFVVRFHGRLIGGVRARQEGDAWDIGRIMVAPDLQGRGLGRFLLEYVELAAPPEVTTYTLFTGAGSLDNQRMYKKAGYRITGTPEPGVVSMTKSRPAR